ncbi:hypothetical protein B9Z55_018973 [Caenorhabditis nigoni]|uniref:Nuclear receptor domain-containing protein n=1 Tax=Caenorhabditis nigoni TaxID=1611254 RepID=A0A2G5TH86_9PELO|nr:hypothetical protein B9Z55_018973 [Caenorhabditis nigoni]
MSNEPSTSESANILPDILIESEQIVETSTRKLFYRKDQNVLPEKCQICRNPAVGYHYDVASCNGCKAFFRRTVITGRLVKCKYGRKCLDGDDPIDLNKRLCGGCRFEKCEEMGMNPMAIRAEITSKEGKLLKEELIKRKGSTEVAISKKINVEDELTKVMTKLNKMESLLDNLASSTLPRHYIDLRSLSDIIVDTPTLDVARIPNLSFIGDDQVFPDHAGLAHTSFLAVVEFAKMMDFYEKIDTDSSLKIVRHGSLMARGLMNSERSIRKFKSDCIRRADGTVAGKPMRNYNGIWVEHRKIVQKSLYAFLRNNVDTTEYLLLKAIILCNPAIPGVSKEAQAIVTAEQQKYGRCLLTYCLREYGTRFGPDRYVSLIAITSVLENQQKEERDFNVILRAFYSKCTVLVSPMYDEIMAS